MDLNPAQRQPSTEEPGRSVVADMLVIAGIVAGIFSLMAMGRQADQPFQAQVNIHLSPWYLPLYTLYSFTRGAIAYVLSITFTLMYARWAAYDRRAERVLIPLLDILQSLPLTSFLVPIEIALLALFPHSNLGLELTCIIVIFTGQAWNMTFSFYYSLKALPDDFKFVGQLARFTPWQKFTQIEIPFATKGLVYNSMVSMAGGWFFLSITETFTLNGHGYQVRGLGSYMNVAREANNGWAQVYDIIAMVLMIVALDQLVWRPLLVWSNKFKLEDTESEFQDRSAILRYLGRSRVAAWMNDHFSRFMRRPVKVAAASPTPVSGRARLLGLIPWRKIFLLAALVLIGVGAYNVVMLLAGVKLAEWGTIFYSLVITLVRVLGSIALSTVIAVPLGVWIGSNPKLSRYLMPLTQIVASFPAPLVFPNLILAIYFLGGNVQWGAVILMMLGTIWYILFNVISGASAVPQDLRACTQLTHLTRWQAWRTLWLPGVFPALTTGWITAAGGAWNASIVSEYVQVDKDTTYTATGLGSLIQKAGDAGDYSLLAAAVLVMGLFVVFFNRLVWKRLSAFAQTRFQLLT